MKPTIDPDREHLPETGIVVRGIRGKRWGPLDIAHLTRESLHEWLRSRGGDNPWAESVVLMLLDHEPIKPLAACECQEWPAGAGTAWLDAYGLLARDLFLKWSRSKEDRLRIRVHHPRCQESMK